MEVTYEVARFIRRCLDFKSMERGVRVGEFPRLESFIKVATPIVRDVFT